MGKNAPVDRITKEYKEAITTKDYNLEPKEATQDPILTNLTIRIVDFYGDKKWAFMYAGKAIEPEFEEKIQEQLKNIREKIRYNSKLPVEMIITYEEDENGEAIEKTEKYKITKITGELIQEIKDS